MLESYNEHKKEFELGRRAKQMDLNRSKGGECFAAYVDMLAVQPTPSGNVSRFYYKRRLSTYNFTIFNMGTSTGQCFI
ncbi:hypothetical protein PR048_013849 [Dryococelus australis]|uniref:Uncharacterized protein n=1 Tax=Dryococelus australis TaxID=614101 RepID=A0ABQ9HU69_9NEOP|nr:hypothetical protein PR048_013849 [Dryococelus australis]